MTTARAAMLAAVLGTAFPAPALAQAPEPAPGPDAQEARSEEEARDLKRILHLGDGSLVRARARRAGDAWEVRQKGEWRPIPAAFVTRVVDERRALEKARELEGAIDSPDPVRRVALADWMVGQGLVEEALEQLDRVLRAEPGQADAVRMLQSPPAHLQVFRDRDDPDELVREAAHASPAVRELALARLAELEEDAVLYERYREALGSHSHRIRTLAAQGLGRQFPGEEVRGLLVRSVLDGSEDVRREAAVAIGQAGEPALVLPLLRAMGSEHSAVRENAIEALGNAGYPAAVPALIGHMANVVGAAQSGGFAGSPRSHIFVGRQVAYIQDFDVEVAQFAAVADPQVNVLLEGGVLDVRVHGVHVTSVAVESRKLRTSLAQLTGANPGRTNRAWLDWWEQNQGDWTGAEPPPRTTASD